MGFLKASAEIMDELEAMAVLKIKADAMLVFVTVYLNFVGLHFSHNGLPDLLLSLIQSKQP